MPRESEGPDFPHAQLRRFRLAGKRFEHRLRASKHPRSKLRGTGPKGNEDAEGYAFYIFMNPYRAGLMTVTESWPGWIRSDAKRFRFLDALDENGAPPAEWLNRDETAGGTIVTGE